MAVNEGQLLAVDGDRNVPGPEVLNHLAVLLLGVVELGEVVALPVGGDLEGGGVVLTADHEDTGDDTVVVGTVNTLSTEDVLAGGLKTGVETTDQVVGHEGELQLVVVLVVDLPEGVLLGLEVLPEEGQSIGAGVFVGVLALPVIEDEGGLLKGLQGVLGLRLGGLLSGRGRGSSSSSGRSLGLLLLLGGSVLDGLLNKDGAREDSLESVLVDDSGVPAGDSGVGAAPLLVQNGGEGTGEKGGGEDVSQGDALTDQVGVGGQVGLKGSNGLQSSLGGIVDDLLVVGGEAEEGTVPATEVGQLAVDEGHPADDGSIVLLGLTQEGGLLVLGGN